jgi:hypothetical protein
LSFRQFDSVKSHASITYPQFGSMYTRCRRFSRVSAIRHSSGTFCRSHPSTIVSSRGRRKLTISSCSPSATHYHGPPTACTIAPGTQGTEGYRYLHLLIHPLHIALPTRARDPIPQPPPTTIAHIRTTADAADIPLHPPPIGYDPQNPEVSPGSFFSPAPLLLGASPPQTCTLQVVAPASDSIAVPPYPTGRN